MFAVVALIVGVLAAGCGLDGGIEPVASSVRGRIGFVGAWPDSIAEVRLVAYADYPPERFTDLVAWSDPLPLGVPAHDYVMPLPPGEYALLVLAVRTPREGWRPIAQYNPSGGFVPDTIRLADRRSVMRGVDFTVPFATSAIAGRLIYANAWPDTVSAIRVGAIRASLLDPRHPPITLDDIANVSRTYSRDDTSRTYRIALPPGTYRTIGVIWTGYRSDGNPENWTSDILRRLFSTRGLPVLGVHNDDGSLAPDSVVLGAGEVRAGVDIVVDFSRTRLR